MREVECSLASNAGYAFWHAKYNLGGRYLEGEAAILSDPYWAYRYRNEVLNPEKRSSSMEEVEISEID